MHKSEVLGEQLLSAVAYGDAAGLPFEGKKLFPVQDLHDLRDTTSNPFIGEYPAGTWSDDTHLSLASSLSLIESTGFSLESQGQAHVKALAHVTGEASELDWTPPIVTDSDHSGWGRSTTRAVERIAEGVSPYESGQKNGAGNGILMKMAPLVYWQLHHVYDDAEKAEQLTQFTRMTHDSDAAVGTTLAHAKLLETLYRDDEQDFSIQLDGLVDTALAYEADYKLDDATSTALAGLAEVIWRRGNKFCREDIAELVPGKGFYAPETLVMAYGNFALNDTFPHSVYRAVEMGGDADSIGSIVAAMSLFKAGSIELPTDYNKIFDYPRLERVSKQLTKLVLA